MFVLTSIQTLAVHQYFNIGYRVGMHVRTAPSRISFSLFPSSDADPHHRTTLQIVVWCACVVCVRACVCGLTGSIAVQIRGSVVVEVYRKAFRQSASARQQSTVGEIVNLYPFIPGSGFPVAHTNKQ
jgi:hypothetical protein